MKELNFNEVLKAILLLKEIEKIPLKDLARQYAKFSNQEIPNEAIESWSMTGLGNEYFLTSDHLVRYDLKPIQLLNN